MTNPNQPCKPYSHVIDNLVKHGDTDWFGGEEHLVPDEIEIGPKDMGGIKAIADAYGREIADVTKDVRAAAELEVDAVNQDEIDRNDAIAAIIAQEEADDAARR
ncbi:hypothetical protein A4G86_20810 [Burkholderia pseudomallei]|uniref:hypothetical protein n=1 Tax=Burkholderia pseudomallei TaxID=28450 RepID=UPI000DC30DC7|nr:hypothetical protein [Burkholderia pseudomallei]RAQ84742.1 hypothetical protein A4G86_20810 [Burkholderia pseudomallei]